MSRARVYQLREGLRIEIEGAGYQPGDAALCIDYPEDEETQAVIFSPEEDEPLCRIVFDASGITRLIVHSMATELQDEKYSVPGNRVYMFPQSDEEEEPQ